MNETKSNLLNQQKRLSRGLKGIIVALLALIGILKISIGGVINVPVAFLFGDIFIAFFALQFILAFYMIFLPKAQNKKRTALIFVSLFGLLLMSSAFYAGILRDYARDGSLYGDNLASMVILARETFSFTPPKNAYFYSYGGILGEGLLYLFRALPVWLIITLFVLFTILFGSMLLWPFLVKIYAVIKEKIRDTKKRRKVLREAAFLGHEEIKEDPDHIPVTEMLSENTAWGNNLLHRVGGYDDNEEKPVVTAPTVKTTKSETNAIHRASPKEELNVFDEHFELPTLGGDEDEFAPLDPLVIDSIAKVESEQDFTDLERAVDEQGTFEAVSFEVVEEVKDERFQEVKEPEIATNDSEIALNDIAPAIDINEVAPQVALQVTREMPVEEPGEETKKEPFVPEPLPPLPEPIKQEEGTTKARPKSKFTNYVLPKIDLLDDDVDTGDEAKNREIAKNYEEIINRFFVDFNIDAQVFSWTIGSTFTRFEIKLGPTESVKSIGPLVKDIAIRLEGPAVRFEEILPGKATSGLEVENTYRTNINFKECMRQIVANKRKKFLIPFGKDVAGNVILAPFTDFPHLLVAGQTGSGKSVFVHTILTSLIMMHTPLELRLMLIDPKRVELAAYKDIPHLLTPIIKEPSEAKVALERLIDEMENRYKLFEDIGVGKISDYNDIITDMDGEKLPTIICVVDEFADLFESEKDISTLVLRLVQKSRAAGIHILIATQRPTVQVITGNIKANIPSRVAFSVYSATDSMTILGVGGAESLLGYGDMLVDSLTTNYRGLLRIQAPFIKTREVLRVTNYLRNNYLTDFYPEFLDLKEKVNVYSPSGGPVISDDLYQAVLDFTLQQKTISISRLQQNFNLGWPRARQLYDQLMQNGIIEAPDEANSAKGAVVIANKGE